jgi:hypothetical protein
MQNTTGRMRLLAGGAVIVLASALGAAGTTPAVAASKQPMHIDCAKATSLCAEVHDSELVFGEDVYVGHDEPSLLFYDSRPGSGNNSTYLVKLPKDPPTLPTQDGTGGTFNFQLHPAFWLGLALCDNESAPEFTHAPCVPDSDTNIFDSADAGDPHYIGKHPGAAFLEVQFYPPGYTFFTNGISCDALKWCASMAIFSLNLDQNTGVPNNTDCLSRVGIEPANFAFITKNGKAHAPADPLLATIDTFTPNPATDVFMNSGDQLSVSIHDSAAGLRVDLADMSTGQTGSMTASMANQFGQVVYDPNATTCTTRPYAFRPMYATSSEHTRVPWAAHGYNVAFSDEIGHFEYCNAVDGEGGACVDSAEEPDADDFFCFSGATSLRVHVGGCLATENDFDGTSYQKVWAGSTTPDQDARLHPTAIQFSSPRFNGGQRYERVAFEADLPRIEAADVIDPSLPACNRTTGANCVNPPPNAQFYPIYSTRGGAFGCEWQFGGPNIPGTMNTFGGTSTAEFGPLVKFAYPGPAGTAVFRFNNFRQVLASNPC